MMPPSVGPTEPLPMYGTDQKAPVLTSTAPTPRLPSGKVNKVVLRELYGERNG